MPPKADPKPDPIYYGRPTLKGRGWTDTLISRFLPEPDATAVNPHYRSGPPRKLYLIARVEEIERSAAFEVRQSITRPRRRAAAKAVATKQAAMRRHTDGVRFAVPEMPKDDLVRAACRHFNGRRAERAERRGGWDWHARGRPATPESDAKFLERICVNYLRHAMTSYHDRLDAVRGKVGVDMAYEAIVAKVLDAIAGVYPWLNAECGRQKAARVGTREQPNG